MARGDVLLVDFVAESKVGGGLWWPCKPISLANPC